MAISKRLRYEILRRDNHACRYCGAKVPDVALTVDHVIPVSLGGTDEPTNLVAACQGCNAGKSSSSPDAPLVADVDKAATRWAGALLFVAQDRAAHRTERYRIEEFLLDCWETNRPHQFRSCDLPDDWMESVEQFLNSGLEVEDIEELMLVALRNRSVSQKWKYFCGCCWRRVRQAREAAAELVRQWEEADDGA